MTTRTDCIMATKTFKEYYTDPEFRAKHKEKMRERIQCECGKLVNRYNMSHHKKSHIHIKIMEHLEEINELKSKSEQLQVDIHNLIKEKKKVDRELKKLQ